MPCDGIEAVVIAPQSGASSPRARLHHWSVTETIKPADPVICSDRTHRSWRRLPRRPQGRGWGQLMWT